MVNGNRLVDGCHKVTGVILETDPFKTALGITTVRDADQGRGLDSQTTIGLENIVVAHSPDATLVCHIDQTHRLKELLELIGDHGGKKFL